MTRLILTGWNGFSLENSGLADVVIPFTFRFVWGPLPSPDKLASYVAARSDKHAPGTHWSDFVGRWPSAAKARKDLGLLEFCRHTETVELWFDPDPNEQLQLVWLLDYFCSHPEIVARLRLRLVDYNLISASHEELGRWKMRGVDVTKDELGTASATWQAYRATTPEACVDLIGRDLSALPLLRPALLDLIEELPSRATGLGATEMRLLELIARDTSGRMRSFTFGVSAGGVYLPRWNSVPCSRASRSVRDRRWRDSTTNCARSRGITPGAVTRRTSEADCR